MDGGDKPCHDGMKREEDGRITSGHDEAGVGGCVPHSLPVMRGLDPRILFAGASGSIIGVVGR